jgi:hypothetical protein
MLRGHLQMNADNLSVFNSKPYATGGWLDPKDAEYLYAILKLHM